MEILATDSVCVDGSLLVSVDVRFVGESVGLSSVGPFEPGTESLTHPVRREREYSQSL